MSTHTNGKSDVNKKKMDPDDRMKMLERRAKVVRSRLVRAIDSLDTRRHQIETIGSTAKRLAVPLAVSAVGIVALFGASALAFGLAIKKRRRLSLSERLAKAVRGLDLVRQPSLARRMADKAALTLMSIAITEIAKHAVKNLVDGRLPDGRIAAHHALEQHHHPQAPAAAAAAAAAPSFLLEEAKP